MQVQEKYRQDRDEYALGLNAKRIRTILDFVPHEIVGVHQRREEKRRADREVVVSVPVSSHEEIPTFQDFFVRIDVDYAMPNDLLGYEGRLECVSAPIAHPCGEHQANQDRTEKNGH